MPNTVASLNARVGLTTTNYERGAQRLNRANRELRQEQARLRRESQQLSRQLQRNVTDLRNAALRVAAVGTAFALGVQRLASFGDELGKTSDRLGISIRELQTLQFAADSVGIPFDKVSASLQTLQVRFARLGLDTSSFRTELEALNPRLLRQLDSIDNTSEAYRVYIERIREAQRAGRDLEALQLAQAGFGQGGALPVLQVLQEQERSGRVLAEAGVLFSDEDREAFANISQAFTDLTTVVRNQLVVALVTFEDEIVGFVNTIRSLLTGIVPLTVLIGGAVAVFSGIARLAFTVGGAALSAVRNINQLGRTQFFARLFDRRAHGHSDAVENVVNGAVALAGLGGAGYGFGQYLRLQDSLTERRVVQGSSLYLTEEDRRSIRRALLPSEAASLRGVAEGVFGSGGVQNLLNAAGVGGPPAPRPPVGGTFVFGPGGALIPELSTPPVEDEDFGERLRAYNAEVNRVLRAHLVNVLGDFRSGIAEAVDEATDEDSGFADAAEITQSFGSVIDAERNRLFRFYQSRVFTPQGRGRRLGDDFGVGDLGSLESSLDALTARNEALERAIEEAVASNILRDETNAALRDPLARGGRSPAETLREANELLSDDLVRRSRIGELGRFIEDAGNAAAQSEPAFRRLLVDTFLDAENRTERLRGVVRGLIGDLIDLIALQPLSNYLGTLFQGFVGGFAGGGSAPTGGGPPPGGPIPGPGAATSAFVPGPSLNPVAAGPNVNIVVNGVEDQAAFDRVSSAVEQRLVPTVVNTLAANANRPGRVRAIRGR